MSSTPESSYHADPVPNAAAAAPKPGMKRRWLFIIVAVTFLFVLMPFLFWQATWFGRPLDDAQLAKALSDTGQPREIQHGLSQLADRMIAPNVALHESARRFYPEVVRIAQTGGDELRLTAAWVMGQDNSVPEFHAELLRLLSDSNPMVRRNAALALVRFGDTAGRDEIRAILQPYGMPAPQSGKLSERLRPGDEINPGTLLGGIEIGDKNSELRSQVPGVIKRWLVPANATVAAGQPIIDIDPSASEVWEALRALYLIGQKQDLAAIEPFADASSGVPPNVRQQAELTARAIRSRP